MNEPIYPDKTKTGLAALKPIVDAWHKDNMRWHVEYNTTEGCWKKTTMHDAVMGYFQVSRSIRLTPKPRRVWIGDQELHGVCERFPESLMGCWIAALHLGEVIPADKVPDFAYKAYEEGLLFWSRPSALHGLESYRKARRVE